MSKRKVKALFRNIVGKMIDTVLVSEERQIKKAISKNKTLITF